MKKISFAIIVIILIAIPCLSWPLDISPEDVDLTASLDTLPPDLSVSSESTQLKLTINLFNNSNKPLVNIDNGDGNFYFYTVYIYTPPDYRYEIFNYPEANSSQFLMGGDSRTLNLALNSLKNYLSPSDIENYLSPTDLGKNRLTIADSFMYSGKIFPAAIKYYFSKDIKDKNKTFYVIFSYYQMKFNNIISWAKVIPIEMTPKQKPIANAKINLNDPKIFTVLKNEYPGTDNFRLIMTKPLGDKIIALCSYDRVGRHYNEYRFIVKKNDKFEVLGGGGGTVEHTPTCPFTFCSGSGSSDSGEEKPYCLAYGETFDDKIKQIRIEFNNGKIMTEKVFNNGYLVIDEENTFTQKIEALDEESNVLYHLGD